MCGDLNQEEYEPEFKELCKLDLAIHPLYMYFAKAMFSQQVKKFTGYTLKQFQKKATMRGYGWGNDTGAFEEVDWGIKNYLLEKQKNELVLLEVIT